MPPAQDFGGQSLIAQPRQICCLSATKSQSAPDYFLDNPALYEANRNEDGCATTPRVE